MTRQEIEKCHKRILQKIEDLVNEIDILQDSVENEDYFDNLSEAKYTLDGVGQEVHKAVGIYENGGLDDELE